MGVRLSLEGDGAGIDEVHGGALHHGRASRPRRERLREERRVLRGRGVPDRLRRPDRSLRHEPLLQ